MRSGGNVTQMTDPAGQTSSFTYNFRSQLETATNPLGELTTYIYTNGGNLASIQEPELKSTTFTYDSAERVASATDSEGYTIQVAYDVFDRPTTLTYPDGTTDTLEYDRLNLVRTQDRIGRVTQMQHDALGRPTSVTDANGGVVALTYGLEDSPNSLTDPNGNTTNFQFDLQQRLIAKTYPGGASQTIDYESCVSRVESVTDALGQSKTYGYFIDNQLKSVEYSDDTPMVQFTQDSFLPRPLSMTDGQGVTTMTYGSIGSPGANALASIDGPYGDQATFTYDIAGRPVSQNVNGSVESVTFDQLWRPTSTTNALDTFQMAYLGKTGQVTQVNSSQGPTSQYTYTANSTDRRLAQIKNLRSNGTAISQFDYNYDPIGQITQMTKIHGTTGGGTTGGGTGTTSTTGGDTGTGGTTGTTTTGTGTGGSGTTGTSDTGTGGTGDTGTTGGTATTGDTGTTGGTGDTGTSGGTTTTGTGGTSSGNGTGNGNGNGTGTGNGNGTGNGSGNGSGTGNGNGNGNNGVGNGIDPQPPGNPPINDGPGTGPGNPGNGKGKGKGKGSPTSQMIQVIQNIWGWDTSGWDENVEQTTDEPQATSFAVAAITNTTETCDFRYDNLSQLVGVDINQTPHASYGFDLAGNMTSVTLNGITTDLAYNNLNQTATPGTNQFDLRGQTTDQDGRTFEWDAQGRVTAIVQGTQRSEFEYDGMSRRTAIQELEDGVIVSRKLYWWLGGAIVCERDGLQTGFPITKRYFGQGVLDGTTKLYYTLDHLGSVQELTDETGEVVADYRYSIYGERTRDSGDVDSDFGFAGLFHHEPSGLDLATYRLYDSRQRRFISRDPLGEAVDYNLYRYANNNPVNYVDPEGLDFSKITGSTPLPLGFPAFFPGLGSAGNQKACGGAYLDLILSDSSSEGILKLRNADGYDIKFGVADKLPNDGIGGTTYNEFGVPISFPSSGDFDESGKLKPGSYFIILDQSFVDRNSTDLSALSAHEVGHAVENVFSGSFNRRGDSSGEEDYIIKHYENPFRSENGLDLRPNFDTIPKDY